MSEPAKLKRRKRAPAGPTPDPHPAETAAEQALRARLAQVDAILARLEAMLAKWEPTG